MNNKKYLCFMLIFLVSIITVSAVSAADDSNDIIGINTNEEIILDENINEDLFNSANEDTVLEEDNNPIDADVSTISEESDLDSSNEEIAVSDGYEDIPTNESNSTINDEDEVTIEVVQENNFLILSAIDSNGNIITEGDFTFMSKGLYPIRESLYGMPSITFNLFSFPYEEYPQNISISFISDEGQTGQTSFFATLENTLFAHDVVNESEFEAYFLINNYHTSFHDDMRFKIFDENGGSIDEVYILTDLEGRAVLRTALEPGNYTVLVENTKTSQYGIYSWNISERDPAKESKINATFDGYNINFTILDGLDNPIYGYVDVYVNDTYLKNTAQSINLYLIGDGHLDIFLEFKDKNYFRSNASFSLDLHDTIIIDDLFYNTTKITFKIVDYDGNPIKDGTTYLYVGDVLYLGHSDDEGNVEYDLNLLPGQYDIKIHNTESQQSKNTTVEVIEEYDSKKAIINVSQDNYKFTIDVTDIYGNKIDGGNIKAFYRESSTIPLINGTATYIFDSPNIYDGDEIALTFTLQNNNYYPVQATVQFTFIDTIISNDVLFSDTFNATMLDMNKNPIEGMEVTFKLFDRDFYETIAILTAITDENGVASIKAIDQYFNYGVHIINNVTYQGKTVYWANKKPVNFTILADYVDESTGIYYINGHNLTFKFDEDVTGLFKMENGEYLWAEEIIDGYCEIYLLELREYNVKLYYFGDSKYLEEMWDCTIIASKMKTPNMTVSENLIIDILDKKNFTVKLSTDQGPISNASVEIKIGNKVFNVVTDANGNANLPINLSVGKYDVSVSYKGSPSNVPANKTTTLTVNKASVKLTAASVSTIYNKNKNLVITLKDRKGNPIKGVQLTVKIGSSTKKYKTDKNGQVKINIAKMVPKTYTAKITFAENGNYNKASANAKVVVKKAKPKIAAKNKAFKHNLKVKKYAVTLKNNINKIMKNTKLILRVNKKNFTAKTNKKGVATFKITNLKKKGKFTAAITYKASRYYLKVSKKTRITIK